MSLERISRHMLTHAAADTLPRQVRDLLQLENYIVDNMKSEMVQLQQNAVQNHTATMLEIGTSLLSQTAEQTRKLTDVETQVLNQTSRLEIQLLENSLSTYKLEKQLLQQTHEILKIHEKNRDSVPEVTGFSKPVSQKVRVAQPPWLMGSAVPCGGFVGAGWNQREAAVSSTGQPRPLLTEAIPAAAKLPRPGTPALNTV
ncbi:PREDICTED: angiopoietin-4-like, partial [Fulmarus glacialis]|uniref:angiopoietin-4-like n=1 Tax=Fulmarus glacialis TaxID=30455 RepID=UPI00051BDB1D